MLKVLIVDDESLVRAGIWHAIPWRAYEMEPVAEADGVDAAIKILAERHIDIVFTDILMPGKNGLELLRWIQSNAPLTTAVVLSYHSDFQYIQKALRYGAVDYILKTELDCAEVEYTLRHVAQKAINLNELNNASWSRPFQSAVALVSISGCPVAIQEADLLESKRHIQVSRSSALLLYESILPEERISRIEERHKQTDILMVFQNIAPIPVSNLLLAVKLFVERDLFYLYLPDIGRYDLEVDAILGRDKALSGPEYVALEEDFSSMQWIYDKQLFNSLLERIFDARPLPSVIYNLFYSVQAQWSKYFPDGRMPEMFPISHIRFWHQWVDWLHNFRTFIATESHLNAYSPEIVASIQRLVLWLNDHYIKNVRLKDAAKMVNLSESHLSRTFKEIVGIPFNAYVRALKISNAKKMLTQTRVKVSKIAELCGFSDQFYFDKIFKAQTGMTPSAYRNAHSKIERTWQKQ